jgi:hypothetical protein
MWIEKRRQQHRAYWRKRIDGKDYEAFGTKTQAQEFIDLCNKFGRDKVVARHRARGLEQAPTVGPPRRPRASRPVFNFAMNSTPFIYCPEIHARRSG